MAKKTRNQKIAEQKQQRQNQTRREARRVVQKPMPFEKRNYLLMLLGIACIVIGYTIMRMENEVDGVISLYVAPIILTFGYLEIIYAIMWRSKSEKIGA